MGRDRVGFWFWFIMGLALLLRVGAAIGVQHIVSKTPGRLCLIAGDAEGYWELGRQIARGKNFEIYDPPRRVLRMPGFPAILATSMVLFGDDVGHARLVLAVVGTIACGLLFRFAKDLFGSEVALIATALAAFSPTFIVFSVMILSETAFAATLLLSLISLVWLMRSLSENSRLSPMRRALAVIVPGLSAGLAAAGACYMRPSWLLFPHFVLAIAWIFPGSVFVLGSVETSGNKPMRGRQRIIWAGVIVLLGIAIGLSPWTIRNYFVTEGKLVPTTLWMGPSLYDGLNPIANGDSHMEFLPNSVYEEMSEYDVDRHYRREAWKWAAANPTQVLQLAWIKQYRYWNVFPNTPQFDHWFVSVSLLAFVVPVLAFAVYGMIIALRSQLGQNSGWFWSIALTVGPILYFSALHSLFVSSLRYRLPAEYPLLALTGLGIWHFCYNCRSGR